MKRAYTWPNNGGATMARKRSKTLAAAVTPRPSAAVCQEPRSPAASVPKLARNGKNTWSHLFSELACKTAHFAGRPVAFLTATLLVVLWACTGPLFNYSDTWQLVINTSTTIVTFLMVFLIQHTQNRDTLALQLKLSELIIAVRGAENRLAAAEDMTEEDLEQLHAEYRARAEATLDHLEERRGGKLQRAS
jgi:low affinity Fe/Cu permease